MPSRNLVLRILEAEIPELKRRLRPATFARGAHLVESGGAVTRIFFPVCGIVSSRAVFETDHEMELVTTGRNSGVGVLAALGFEKSMTRDVCATDVHGWEMTTGDVRRLLLSHPEAEEIFRGASFAQMTYAVKMATCNATHTAEQRLARWLLIAAELLTTSDIRMPQEELANILGIRRSHLNPLLQRFRTEQLIELGRQRITVSDVGALKRRACSCYREMRVVMGASVLEADVSEARFRPTFTTRL